MRRKPCCGDTCIAMTFLLTLTLSLTLFFRVLRHAFLCSYKVNLSSLKYSNFLTRRHAAGQEECKVSPVQ